MTRVSASAKAMCVSSEAPSKPASAVVVTSIPSERSPAATAGETCSSRWKRIVATGSRQFLLELRRAGLRPEAGHEFLLVRDVFVDLVLVRPVVRQRRVDRRPRQLRVLLDDPSRRHPFLL